MYNDFDQRMKEVKAEVVSTIKLNAAFQLFHLLPLCYLGMYKYRKVESSNTSCLEAHAGFFRLLMKGIFNLYVL